jgi:hypothetical protein
MEKTIEIDGKKIKFKSTAATPLRFKRQFGKDFFAEICKLEPMQKSLQSKKLTSAEKLAKVDFELFYNIAWVLAKTADDKIPEPLTWLDGFDVFPIGEIFPELNELIVVTMQGKKK